MLRVKIRPHQLTTKEAEILREVAAELERMASDLAGLEVLEYLENTASDSIRLSSRNAVTFMDTEAALDALYVQEVANGLLAESGEADASPVRAGLGSVEPFWAAVPIIRFLRGATRPDRAGS